MISIVILAHNELASTKRCINSVIRYTAEPYKLILVNNGSTDGTKEYFESLEATVINFAENKGFIIPNNEAMKLDRNDILLLNNDIEIVSKGWLATLRKKLYESEDVGLAYPLNQTRGISYAGGVIKDKKESLVNYKETPDQEVTWAQFCCVLIKRSVIDKIGLLDEQFSPGYFEDVDYCTRLKLEGYKLRLIPEITVMHYQSVTSKKLNLDHYRYKNREKFYKKWPKI